MDILWAKPKYLLQNGLDQLHVSVMTLQIGNAVRVDKDQHQWLDLGDMNGTTCWVLPHTCTNGSTISFLMKHIDHDNRFSAYISSTHDGDNGCIIAGGPKYVGFNYVRLVIA